MQPNAQYMRNDISAGSKPHPTSHILNTACQLVCSVNIADCNTENMCIMPYCGYHMHTHTHWGNYDVFSSRSLVTTELFMPRAIPIWLI